MSYYLLMINTMIIETERLNIPTIYEFDRLTLMKLKLHLKARKRNYREKAKKCYKFSSSGQHLMFNRLIELNKMIKAVNNTIDTKNF